MVEMKINSFIFCSPCTISISGATSSGKTSFVKKLIEYKDIVFQNPPEKIIYCYGTWQPLFNDMESVDFRQGLSIDANSLNECDDCPHTLMVLDDLMQQVVENNEVQQLFTRGSHHKNITVIYINQNMFYQGKCSRSINLNSMYLILFKNPRDIRQISTLGSQLGMKQKLTEAYKDMSTNSFGYLLIDLSPHNESGFFLKSQVLPDEDMIVYL